MCVFNLIVDINYNEGLPHSFITETFLGPNFIIEIKSDN